MLPCTDYPDSLLKPADAAYPLLPTPDLPFAIPVRIGSIWMSAKKLAVELGLPRLVMVVETWPFKGTPRRYAGHPSFAASISTRLLGLQ